MTKDETRQENVIVPDGDFVEVEDASFFKFEKVGDKIEGILIDKGQSDRYGFGLYDIKTPDGETFRFHGSAQLDSLLKAIPEDTYIRITYVDDQKLPQGSLKIFKVERKGK